MRTILANRKGGKKYPVTVHNNQEGIARYASDIRVAWEKELGMDYDPTDKPVVLHCMFEFQRPKLHFNSKGELKGMSYTKPAPVYMSQDPDGDKLMRSVMDALKGLAYLDDNQVVQGHFVKLWADKDSTFINVLTMEEADIVSTP
jgi:Holliday junction resolvase RusA-like endonuclease